MTNTTDRDEFGFQYVDEHGLRLWTGRPDCEAAHASLLSWFREHCQPFVVDLEGHNPNVLKGNVGEAIAFYIGYSHTFRNIAPYRFPSNALTPFERISKPGIDITWVNFGEYEHEDFAVLHEIKTTEDPLFRLADELVEDYEKLFGTKRDMMLHYRLQKIKSRLHIEYNEPELARRITRLGGRTPQTSVGIRLLPTLVHERSDRSPHGKMLAVRTRLIGLGWNSSCLDTWSISLTDLLDRVRRLALGRQ